MFNIFQHERLTRHRIENEQNLVSQAKDRLSHSKKTNDLSSLANIRRLEWAVKYLNSKSSKIIQDGTVKLLNSSILELRKDDSSSESESEQQEAARLIRRMDTNILHPYNHKKNQSSPFIEEARSILNEGTGKLEVLKSKSTKKPFIQYSRSYRKNESAWQDPLNSYTSSPYLSTVAPIIHSSQPGSKNVFKLGVKNDVWENVIRSPESIRTYQSNKHLSLLPDMKLYKKSLEHIIRKRPNIRNP